MEKPILEARGLFWWGDEPLSDEVYAPDGAVNGGLEISAAGRSRLRLDRPLPRSYGTNPFERLLSRSVPKQSICGILHGTDEYVRLTELRGDGASASSQGPSSEGFIAQRCLVARTPFPSAGELKFNSIEFSFRGFEDWLHLRSIRAKRGRRSFSVRYARPAKREWKLNAAKLSIEFDMIHPFGGFSNKLSITETARMRLSSQKRFNLDEAIDLVIRIDDLMILLTDSTRGLDFPKLKGSKKSASVQLYFPRWTRSPEPLNRIDLCTFYPRVADVFGEVVDSWLAKYKLFGPGFHLYLGNRRSAHMYPEHRFASFVWGLESLHRRKGAPRENLALDAKIRRILDQVSENKDRDWLERKLRNAKEPSLEDRLFDILAKLPISFDGDELKAFAKRSADRRNDISHFGGMREDGAYEGFLNDIIPLNDALDYLYHAVLLQEIGVPNEEIRWWLMDGPKSHVIRKDLGSAGLVLPTSAASSDLPPAPVPLAVPAASGSAHD